MARLLAGLSGFADPALVERIYPAGTPPQEYLQAYAGVFGAYEAACTSRRQFTRGHAEALASRLPAGLTVLPRMDVEVSLGRGGIPGVRAWADRNEPLLRSSQLGPVHVPWLMPWSAAAEAELETVLDTLWNRLRIKRVAVEFHHPSWFRGDALRLLEEHEAGLVWSTASGLVPYRVTGDHLYLRLTGKHPRDGGEEVDRLLQRMRGRRFDRDVFVIADRAHDAKALDDLQRLVRAVGSPLGTPQHHALARGQRCLDEYAATA